MEPRYENVARRSWIHLPMTFFKNFKVLWSIAFLTYFGIFTAQSQVIISEVFDDASFEITNTGSSTVDISSYWICNFPSYTRLNNLTIACGDLNLSENETVVITANFDIPTDDAELGLYTSNSGNFGNADFIISYLEWGSTGHRRSGIATGKGIWDGNAVAGFSSGQSLELNDTGNAAADWGTNSNPQKCAVAPPPPSTSSARYRVTFDAVWSSTTHPTDFPSNAHFSGLIGLTHTPNVALFELGTIASPGMVNMAETGGKSPLDSEIQTVIAGGQGQTLISGGGIGTSPGTVSVEFDIENSHPLVSITTMIAPSPDWFVGVRDLNLFENGDWTNSLTCLLYTSPSPRD